MLIAIGNEGRRDDGLGWALGRRLERGGLTDGQVHFRYQLQVEDAELVARAEHVVFADACRGSLPNGFELRRCDPAPAFEFTTHALRPEAVLYLCREIYGKVPRAECLLIEGEAWGIGDGLSTRARENLRRAEACLRIATAGFPWQSQGGAFPG